MDNRLGDLIQYAANGAAGGDYVDMRGRILTSEGMPSFRGGLQRIDEVRGGWMLRVAKDLVPAPSKNDRVKCASMLGDDVYRPIGSDPIGDGRYWLVELQKV